MVNYDRKLVSSTPPTIRFDTVLPLHHHPPVFPSVSPPTRSGQIEGVLSESAPAAFARSTANNAVCHVRLITDSTIFWSHVPPPLLSTESLIRYRRHDERVFLPAFDLIEFNGDDLRREALVSRKATLAIATLARSKAGATCGGLSPSWWPISWEFLKSLHLWRYQSEAFWFSSLAESLISCGALQLGNTQATSPALLPATAGPIILARSPFPPQFLPGAPDGFGFSRWRKSATRTLPAGALPASPPALPNWTK